MPSSDTRTLISRSCSAQNLTMRVSIGIARCGVRPVVLMPILRIRGRWRWNISTISGRSLRVVGSPPEMFRFSTCAPERVAHRRLELRERHVRLAIAVLPVVAHLALGVADPGAVVDEHGRPDRLELRRDERLGEVAGHARRGARQVSKPESTCGHWLYCTARSEDRGGKEGGGPKAGP